MDALELDESHSVKEQAHGKLLERELVKCLSGFSSLEDRTVATGAWGCGAFGGDKDVKFGKIRCLSIASLTNWRCHGTGSDGHENDDSSNLHTENHNNGN